MTTPNLNHVTNIKPDYINNITGVSLDKQVMDKGIQYAMYCCIWAGSPSNKEQEKHICDEENQAYNILTFNRKYEEPVVGDDTASAFICATSKYTTTFEPFQEQQLEQGVDLTDEYNSEQVYVLAQNLIALGQTLLGRIPQGPYKK